MAADLHLGDKRIFMPIADRFTECEQTIYTNMNKVADLRHTDEQKQAMQIVALKKLLEDKDKQITRYISFFKFIKKYLKLRFSFFRCFSAKFAVTSPVRFCYS